MPGSGQIMMYYKIITQRSFFTELYENMDVFNIPCGTVFVAPKTSKYRPDDPKCLINESVFHFSRGAFDTMLWHTRLIHHVLPCQIYAIQPLTNVTRQRCLDDLGLYQCGAQQIKFLEKQDVNKMYELAVKEYMANPTKYNNFKISVDWWKKHQPTVFRVYESYHR